MDSAVGRLMRHLDGRWQPVGEPLPPFPHAPPQPNRSMAPWVLPRDLGAEPGDVLVCGEIAHRLLAPMDADDDSVIDLWEQTVLLHGSAAAREWFAQVEVWLGMQLADGQAWAPPPQHGSPNG